MSSLPPVEHHVAEAIERLREDMPKAFILVYATGDEADETERFAIITHCSLSQAQRMLPFAMEQMSHNYALRTAKESKP